MCVYTISQKCNELQRINLTYDKLKYSAVLLTAKFDLENVEHFFLQVLRTFKILIQVLWYFFALKIIVIILKNANKN